MEKLGYRPHTAPAANLSETYKNPDGITRPGCAYCGYCERFGCMIGAKAQPTNTLLPVLARRKTFTMRTGCWVRRVVHKDGHATGVQYVDANGEEVFQPADAVVLATFTLNNVRLLALSKIGTAYDPSTAKGTLGKNLTHQVVKRDAVFDRPERVHGERRAGHDDRRFRWGSRPDDPEGIVRGGTISVGIWETGPLRLRGCPAGTVKPGGLGMEGRIARVADKVSASDSRRAPAYRHNFMDLDPQYTTRWGPLLRFTLIGPSTNTASEFMPPKFR